MLWGLYEPYYRIRVTFEGNSDEMIYIFFNLNTLNQYCVVRMKIHHLTFEAPNSS